ncbi:MAG: glycine cleavage system protein H [Bdellovibrionota bacterium]
MSAKQSRAANIVEFNDGKLWFQKKSNILTLGITLDGLDETGEVEGIHLPEEGDDFDKDDVICEIDGAEGALKVYTPAAGFVTEVNTALADDTQILNEDPIDEGWLVKIEIQDDSDLKEYL